MDHRQTSSLSSYLIFLLILRLSGTSFAAVDIAGMSIPCDRLFRNSIQDLPCLCFPDQENGTVINCDGISFPKEFPVLPHRYRIHSYSQSGSGLQSLEAQLFTASDIPLKRVDFSDNFLRRITERTFDGVEDTLTEIDLARNRLGDQLNPVLSTGEFRRLANLRRLDLSSNQIKALQSDIFTDLKNLQELRLEYNELDGVPGFALRGLQSLQALHLQGNSISSLQEKTFPDLHQLRLLNLSSNDIVFVQNRAFANLPNLKLLVLSYNRIRTFSPEALEGLGRLENFDISQNFLDVIPEAIFSKTPNIKRLILHSNKIKTVDASQLTSLSSLEYLDLSRNRIFGIAANTFVAMTNLKELKLDVNSVRKITDKMFLGLEGLSDLTLNDNRILAFPTEALEGFRKLRKLSLEYNRVAAVSSDILSPVSQLEELSLAFNLISEISDGTFQRFNNLLLLNLHGNKISDFTESKTEGIENSLLYLDIGYNEINKLPKLKFAKLLILSLARNRISTISKETFQDLKELRYLNMSYNVLSEMPSRVFEYLVNLESLDLQHNIITAISKDTFQDLSLMHVNLRSNQILGVPEKAFHNLPRLISLDLSENNIQAIATNAFDSVPNIEILKLMGNELSMFRGDFFSTNTNIHTLDLSYNRITYLYPNSFKVHPKLKHLDLSYNGLTFFPSEIVNPINSLRSINLEGNKLQAVGDRYFSNMPNLWTVNLRKNAVTLVGEGAFMNSSRLHSINLRDNKISFLSENAFDGLNRLELDLANNDLGNLPNEIFSRSAGLKLTSIDLAMNHFRDFPTAALKRQYSFLEHVNMSFNMITNLPSNADVLVNIKELDLSDNPLSKEAHHVLFAEPKSVRKLRVANVGITSLPIIESPFLRSLTLSGNKISGLDSNIFQRTTMLKKLDLSFNEIPNLSINMASVWSKLLRLKSLDISHNPIRYIRKTDFERLNNLKELKMCNLSYITELDCESLNGLSNLESLSAHGFLSLQSFDAKQCLGSLTGLQKLEVEIKESHLKDQLQDAYTPRLNEIAVTGRSLRSISSSAFAGMISPIVKISIKDSSIGTFSEKVFLPLPLSSEIDLDISNNRIRRLTPEILAVLDNKQIDVHISGMSSNPITCDCHINPFWKWVHDKVKDPVIRHSGAMAIAELRCSEPEYLKGRKISEVEGQELICGETTVSPSTTTTPLPPPPSTPKRPTSRTREHPDIIFEPPSTRKPNGPHHSGYPSSNSGSRNALTKVDTMIIGIVAGVVAFVCILIIVICIVRLRRARPHYTAGPLAGPLAFRAQGKCTCLKPPPNSCTCYPMYPVGAPYPALGPPPAAPGSAPHHKMLPPPLPPPPGFLSTMGRNGRPRNTPYYVTYPDSDNDR